MSDTELLRRFEPIARYADGELFHPCAVDEYVRECSLWLTDPDGNGHLLAACGQLDLDGLADVGDVPPGHRLNLRFVDEPLGPLALQRWQRLTHRGRFGGSGRLWRVPLHSRVVDSLLDLTLAVRGRVPGGTAAAADIKVREIRERDGRYPYYGRVIREGGWIVLHYLFFLPMNDWRSGFNGANDHESDWEQVLVYLYPDGLGRPTPRWVACGAHDFTGDDMRRRWDDPRLEKDDTHPVVYVGAGSHATYFEPGDYVMEAEPRILRRFKRVVTAVQDAWRERLGQGRDAADAGDPWRSLLSVPYVDYARGDGVSLGPGQDHEWTPLSISDAQGWVHNYRGLWGLDTHDPLGGERAPAGPKYNRDGSVRTSWLDPLGWAGVDKLFPPPDVPGQARRRALELNEQADALTAQIDEARAALRQLALDVEALEATEYLSADDQARQAELAERLAELHDLQAKRAAVLDTRQAVVAYGAAAEQGEWGAAEAHLESPHRPAPPLDGHSRLIDVWAALSGALAIVVATVLLVLQPPGWVQLAALTAVAIGAIEAATRGKLGDYLMRVVVALALVAVAILVWEFWRFIIVGAIAVVALYMVRDNLREALRG
ncbi:MAG: hypothetical protein ACK2T6_07875 [Anaerolineae bacterium]